jgi:GT2 family glycosyltransferase
MNYEPRRLDVNTLKPRPIMEDITVVIPTLGRSILEESLYWLVNGSAWPGGIIIVDQGRNQQVAAWIDALKTLGIDAQYVPSSQRGKAIGINIGLKRATTQFVAVTDDDCFVDGEWVHNIVAHLRQNPRAIVTGRVEAGSNDVIDVDTSQFPSVQYHPRLTFDHMSGGNMGTSSFVLRRVGLFDEDPILRTCEDGEFAYRSLRAGIPIFYKPDVCVRHFGWRDEEQRKDQYKGYALSHGGFYGKYLRRGDWFIALRVVVHHFRAFRRWLRGAIRNDSEARQFGHAYLTGLLPGIIAGIRRGNG